MKGHLFKNDKLGLVGEWYSIPKEAPQKERDPQELKKDLFRHMDIQQQWSQWQARNGQNVRSGWPNRRRNEEGSSNQKPAQA